MGLALGPAPASFSLIVITAKGYNPLTADAARE